MEVGDLRRVDRGMLRMSQNSGYTILHVLTIGIAAALACAGMAYGKADGILPVVTLIIGGAFGHAHSGGRHD